MVSHPHPIFSFADMLIAGGSAVALRIGYLAAVGSSVDWDGMTGFAAAIGTAIGSLVAAGTALGGIYLKVHDYDSKILSLEDAAAAALEMLAAAKSEADEKLTAAKREADAKVEALKRQNTQQQAEIDRLRQRTHDLGDATQRLANDAAAKSLDPAPINVTVVNNPDHPVPVSVPHAEGPPP